MICVVQRVLQGKVTVAGETVAEIGPGLLILAAVEVGDGDTEVVWTAAKIAGLRIFPSADGSKYFDRDVRQAGGSVLLVSNFTVAAETASGRRPSLSNAAAPEVGRVYFEKLVEAVGAQGVPVQTGRFGAEMEVSLVNDGPVTFIVETPRATGG
jgi:D-tyrosyl-tRNA(Tyr) deacylase